MLLEKARERFLVYLKSIDRSVETIDGYYKDLKGFIIFVQRKYNRPCYLMDITENDIEDFLSVRKEQGIAPSSRSRALNTIRSFYNWAVKKHHVLYNPAQCVDGVKVKRNERTYLTDEEVTQLLDAIPQKVVYAVVKTLYYTGLRISECINLTLGTVDLDNKMIYIINGKGGKDRAIPISDKLYKHLTDYMINIRPKVYSNKFFATARSGTVSASYINEMLSHATINLGWQKHVTCHILRHSFASKLVKEDINIVDLQKLLGHSSLTVTSIYTHTSMENLQNAVNLI